MDALSEHLLKEKLITQEQFDIACNEHKITSEKVGEILVRFGFVKRDTVREAMLTLQTEISLDDETITQVLSKSFLLRTQTMIKGNLGSCIALATLAQEPEAVVEEATRLTGQEILLVSVDPNEIRQYLSNLMMESSAYETDLYQEEDINKVLSAIFNEALVAGATDLHIEQTEMSVHVRQRIDGMLYEMQPLSSGQANKLFSRIKDLAGMDVTEKMTPQDGSFPRMFRGRSIDFRVSTMPVAHGEKITLRVLDKERVMIDVKEIGITQIDEWMELSRLMNGLVLVCGSTGSGKTTTLYSTIMALDKIHKSIYTIEDPVEYKLPYISQAQVNRKTGFDFADFTRNVLRHDPDIVVIGEIRDHVTAENTLHLGDTGHLVYATTHTNDVPSTLIRMQNLGMDMKQLSFILRGILVQKLARKIHKACKGMGCEKCRNSGYSGRTLITEFCRIEHPEDLELILEGKKKYQTFHDDVLHKIRSGITDCPEMSRATGTEIQLCNGTLECVKGDDICKKRHQRRLEREAAGDSQQA